MACLFSESCKRTFKGRKIEKILLTISDFKSIWWIGNGTGIKSESTFPAGKYS